MGRRVWWRLDSAYGTSRGIFFAKIRVNFFVCILSNCDVLIGFAGLFPSYNHLPPPPLPHIALSSSSSSLTSTYYTLYSKYIHLRLPISYNRLTRPRVCKSSLTNLKNEQAFIYFDKICIRFMSPVVLEPPSLNIHMARMQQFNPNITSEHALNQNGESRTSMYLCLSL